MTLYNTYEQRRKDRDNISALYQTVAEWGRKAATTNEDENINKRFYKHVGYKTRETDTIWGRDYWKMFDLLPKEYRDMINEDTGNVNDNLHVAVTLWKDETKLAMETMERILNIETEAAVLQKLPEFLLSEKDKKALAVVLEAMKIAEETRNALIAQRKAEEKEKQEKAKKALGERTIRFAKDTYFGTYNINGRPMNKYELIDKKGIPPHKLIELKKANITKTTQYMIPAGTYTIQTTQKDLDDFDNKPPEKLSIHQIKRGRNF